MVLAAAPRAAVHEDQRPGIDLEEARSPGHEQLVRRSFGDRDDEPGRCRRHAVIMAETPASVVRTAEDNFR